MLYTKIIRRRDQLESTSNPLQGILVYKSLILFFVAILDTLFSFYLASN
jgi:hypothetical protein